MKKVLIIIANVLWVLGFNYGVSAWIYVPDQGDTGWQIYTYTAGSSGFTGTAGFVVSNVIDSSAYPELLLDNLSQAGENVNRGFEWGNHLGYTLLGNSDADVLHQQQAFLVRGYEPTQEVYFSWQRGLSNGVDTSLFHNATGQAGTVGSILETGVTLGAGEQFSFNWAFLGNDMSPWNDFALFYLKDQNGIVFSEGLGQIGSAPAVPIPSSVLLLGSGLLGLLGLARKGKRQG